MYLRPPFVDEMTPPTLPTEERERLSTTRFKESSKESADEVVFASCERGRKRGKKENEPPAALLAEAGDEVEQHATLLLATRTRCNVSPGHYPCCIDCCEGGWGVSLSSSVIGRNDMHRHPCSKNPRQNNFIWALGVFFIFEIPLIFLFSDPSL